MNISFKVNIVSLDPEYKKELIEYDVYNPSDEEFNELSGVLNVIDLEFTIKKGSDILTRENIREPLRGDNILIPLIEALKRENI